MSNSVEELYSEPSELESEWRELKNFLEDLLDDPDLTETRQRNPRHPAVILHDTTTRMIINNRIPATDELRRIGPIIRLLLDKGMWMTAGDGATGIRNALDPVVRRYVIARARQAHTFSDICAELAVWGWLNSRGFDAHLREEDSFPDIEILGHHPFWIEIKRINSESSLERIRKVLKKANTQLKTANPSHTGAVLVHVDRKVIQEGQNDAIPGDIAARIHEVERTLHSTYCRQIAHVIVSWDELGNIKSNGSVASIYVARRRSVVLSHRTPRYVAGIDAPRLSLSMTILSMIDYPGSSLASGDTKITRDLINLSSLIREGFEPPGGIRDEHVITALCEADGISFYELTGMRLLIATKKIAKRPAPYIMLLIGTQLAGRSQIDVISAYRIYDREQELETLANYPMRAFLTILDRFGVSLTVGSHEGRLIPDVVVDVEASTGMPFIATDGMTADPEMALPFLISYEPGSPLRARVRWGYALRTEEYRKAVSARRPLPHT